MEIANQDALLPFLEKVRERWPKKDIWCFTGYLMDRDLLGRMAPVHPATRRMLELIDVLVDGEFRIEEKDITLLYKGSRNQRTINVPASLEKGEIVLWEPHGVTVRT